MADEGVGDRLRRYRRLRRLSQGELAALSGVSRTYIADLERGKILIPREPENLKALARTLGVRLSELAKATGWFDDEVPAADNLAIVEEAIVSEPTLDDERKQAGLVVMRDLFASARRKRTG